MGAHKNEDTEGGMRHPSVPYEVVAPGVSCVLAVSVIIIIIT